MKFLPEFKKYLFSQKIPSSKITAKNYLSDILRFIKWLISKNFSTESDFDPSLVTPQLIELFRSEMSDRLSPASLERNLSSLRKFFNFLVLEGVISKSPLELDSKLKIETDPYRLKDFKNYLYVYNASKLTIKNYLMDIKGFLRWLEEVAVPNSAWDLKDLPAGRQGQAPLSKIDNNLIEEYKKRLPYKPRTINRKLSSLRKYLKWAGEEGLIPENSEKLRIPKYQRIRESGSPSIPSVPKYSKFPPLRLIQKTIKGIVLLPDFMIITPLANLVGKVEIASWKLRGKPVFEKIRSIRNFPKETYAPLAISTKAFSFRRKILFHLAHTRPNWYLKYHSYSISHYLHIAILIVFTSAVGFGFYQSFIQKPQIGVLGTNLTTPPNPRILSFQGRLTDNSNNPITTATSLRFGIYSAATATGSALIWQEVDTVTPDSDGIFSVLLGNNSSLTQDLFAQHVGLWLGVTVGRTAELTPRQQLATVAFAENSETLQGLPPITQTGAATSNVVLALDSSGNLTIGGTATPTFQATGGKFTVSGNVLSLTTTAGSKSNVQIAPDGIGMIDLQKPLQNSTKNNNITSAKGAVEVDSMLAVLATSSGQSALTINQNGAGPLISASTSGTAKFTVDNSGNTTIAGGNFSQTGTGTFSTGTGAVSLNGNTSVTGANTFTVGTGASSLGGTLAVTGNTTLTGNLAVNGGSITTTATTGNLFNTTATTLNIGGAATTLSIGASTGTTTINNAETVTGALVGSSTLAVTGATTLTGALTANGGITDTGNFAQTGSGTFSTGTGAVSLNGNVTLASGKSLTTTGQLNLNYLPTSTTDYTLQAKPAATNPTARWLFSSATYTDTATMMGATTDFKYYAYTNKFSGIYLTFATAGAGYNLSAQYSKGAGVWGALTITDGTTNLTTAGSIYFTPPTDWATDTVNGATGYWIRFSTSTTPTTTAITSANNIEPAGYAIATYLGPVDTSPKFYVDYQGNVQVSTILIAQNLQVTGNVNSSLIPGTNNTYDLGSTAKYWNNGYINTLNANNITATNTTISGTTNETFTINSDNSPANPTESLIFSRTSSPNPVFSWDATVSSFTLNGPLTLSSGTGTATFTLPGTINTTGGSIQTNSTTRIDNAGNLSNIGTYSSSTTLAGTTSSDLISGTQTNNTTGGTQRGLVLTLNGSGVTKNGAYITYSGTGTGTTGLEIAGTWTTGILTNNNSINAGTGAITGGAGSFTTLTSSGATTLGTGSSLTNTFGSGASSINTIGSTTTPGALTLHGATTLDNTFTVSGNNLTSLGGNLTVTGTSWTATPTISGLITATSGLTSPSNILTTGTGTITSAGTLTASNGFTVTTGTISLTTNAASTFALPANTANAFRFTDGTNAYQTIDTRTGTSGVGALTFATGTSPTIASAATAYFNSSVFTPGTVNFSGSTQITSTGTSANNALLFNQPTINRTAAATNLTIDQANNLFINGPTIASHATVGQTETITSSSALRIGTGSALNGTNGAVTNGYGLYVDAPTGATNNYAAVFPTGNVGIGTTGPAASLDVERTLADSNTILLVNGGASSTGYRIAAQQNGTNRFRVAANGVVSIDASGINASGCALCTTTDSGYAATFSGGNVGIGTTSPVARLQTELDTTSTTPFVGGADQNTQLEIKNGGTATVNQYSQMSFYTGGNDVGSVIQDQLTNTTGTGNHTLNFYVNNNAGWTGFSSATLSITGGAPGNVGIGTTTPQQALTFTSGDNFAVNMSTPAAPTVTPTGTTGTTSYTYTVTALDGAGGETVASTATTTTTGNATLNGTNYNAISWTAIQGAASYNVYRTASGGTPSTTGKIGNSATTSLNDTGLAGSGTSPTVVTAYVNKLTASGNSWLLGGNVGIGTTTPGSALQVNGGVAIGYSASQAAPSNGVIINGLVNIGTTFNNAGIGVQLPSTAFSGASQFEIYNNSTLSSAATSEMYGLYSVVNGGPGTYTTSNVYGLYVKNPNKGASQTITTNYGLYVDSQTAGSTNYAAVFAGGNVGIGTTSPSSLLSVGSTSQFQVSSNGNIAGIGTAVSNNTGLGLSGTLTGGGTIERGIAMANLTFTSSATTEMDGIFAGISTPNSVFTTSDVTGVLVGGISKGASHTITRAWGLAINDLTVGTNNADLFIGGGANLGTTFTGNYSIYNNSSAQSYLGTGNVGIGTTSPFALLALEKTGGDLETFRYNSANPRAGLYVGGTSGAAFFGNNLTFSSGNVFNYDKTGTMWYVGDPPGIGKFGIGTATGTAGTSAGTDGTANLRLVIDTAGNVGIGTTSPGNFTSLGFGSPLLDLRGSLNIKGTSGDGAATINLGGQTYRKASISTPVTDASDPYLAFGVVTAGSSSTASEYMRITSGGNVGIGTTSPFALLALEKTGGDLETFRYNSANPRAGLYVGGTSGAAFFGNNLTFSSGNVFNYDKTGTMWYVGDPPGIGKFGIGTATGTAGTSAGTDGTANLRLVIDTAGNVGIGTTSPAFKLTTVGSISSVYNTSDGCGSYTQRGELIAAQDTTLSRTAGQVYLDAYRSVTCSQWVPSHLRGSTIDFTTAPDNTTGAGGNVITMNASGNLVWGTDNTMDIGASGATRPRSIYIAGSINAQSPNTDSTFGDGTSPSVVIHAGGVAVASIQSSGSSSANQDLALAGKGAGVLRLGDGNPSFTGSVSIGNSTGGITANGGIQVGSPTGGIKGAGTINVATDIFKNNTAYTNPDYVLEKFYTGNIVKFINNSGASTYTGLLPLSDVENFAKTIYELPRVASASGIFERGDILLEKMEEAYLYLFNHEHRLSFLESKTCVQSQSSTDFGLVKNICSQTTIEKLVNLGTYVVKNAVGNTITGGQILAEAVIGNLRAGLIQTKELIADTISVNNKIISPVAEIQTVRTNVITPLASNKVVIRLQDNSATPSATSVPKLEVQNASGSAVATFDDKGNASFSGRLNANEATISGTLKAKNVVADNIDSQILNLKSALSKISLPIASPSAKAINIASYSAQLASVDTLQAQVGTFMQGLFAVGPSSFSDASVFGQLSVGGNLVLAQNSINVLGTDLQIQPLKQGGVSFLSGRLYIDANGNLTVSGNTTVKGTLFAGLISPVPGGDLVFNLGNKGNTGTQSAQLLVKNASGSAVLAINNKGDITSSGSAQFSDLLAKTFSIVRSAQADTSLNETIASSSAGFATITAGQVERTIITPFVKANSLIYLTPTSDTQGETPYVARQAVEDKTLGTKASFTIGISHPLDRDIKLNWWVVN